MKRVVKAFEVLKALPVSAAILDASGTIVALNDTWKEFGRRNGLSIPNSGIGSNYLQYCTAGEPKFKTELGALLAGKLDLLTLVYPCHSPGEERWFSLIGVPLSLTKRAGVALMHVNLTSMLTPPMQVETTGRGQVRPTTNVDTSAALSSAPCWKRSLHNWIRCSGPLVRTRCVRGPQRIVKPIKSLFVLG